MEEKKRDPRRLITAILISRSETHDGYDSFSVYTTYGNGTGSHAGQYYSTLDEAAEFISKHLQREKW